MKSEKIELIKLTMELDLKAKEYKKLCDKLDELKKNNVNSNDLNLLKIKQLFEKNYNEIEKINDRIKQLV